MLSLSQCAMKCTCSVLEVKPYMCHSDMMSQRHMQWRVGRCCALSSSGSELASLSHDTTMVATSDNVISCAAHNGTHCHWGRFTPCLSAKVSAMAPNPVFFTASTTVCHVRGSFPVPAWLEVHLPNRSSIQSAGLPPLPVLMASIIW